MQGVTTGHDARFDIPSEEVPWGSIALAVFLTMFGAACFGLAWMHLTQQIFGKEQAEIAFSLVGLLTFIPGGCVAPGCSWHHVHRLQPPECRGVGPAQVHITRGSPSVSGGVSQATAGASLSAVSCPRHVLVRRARHTVLGCCSVAAGRTSLTNLRHAAVSKHPLPNLVELHLSFVWVLERVSAGKLGAPHKPAPGLCGPQ